MSVIIDEIVITVQVGSDGKPLRAGGAQAPVEDSRAIVNECVERVLEILARKEER